MKHLVWFRNDLRVGDNPALAHACAQPGQVEAVYLAAPEQWRRHGLGDNKLDWIRLNLAALQQRLARLGIPLHIAVAERFEDAADCMVSLMQQRGMSHLYLNAEPGYDEAQRDRQVQQAVQQCGLYWHRFSERNLLEPDSLFNGQGQPYRVFTPFARKARTLLPTVSEPIVSPDPYPLSAPVEPEAQWPLGVSNRFSWQPGEEAAWTRLQDFIEQGVETYHQCRDFPAQSGTSGLSPYLALGIISPVQVYHALSRAGAGEGQQCWLNELLWREFYRYLMHHFPKLSRDQAMYPDKEPIWHNNSAWFERWCQGKTGFALVDAGMRQLNQTGWMHNRTRMLCASFLVKDLHIDWRWGERYFMQQLLDGDFASNNGGWQWAAGCGADAAPYFRHFSPSRQAERFDAQGDYQRRFLPELGDGELHYPNEMIDHKAQSQRFTQMVKEMTHVDES
ncbi:cryptochrome/photolyase family protein [Ferrimonas marina]|uniref:Deoxyribodipyrimidine photo-lyase n=1 Tax=Ferrimonas marina TaxID=299255 RepID=A0A1M5Z3Y6_9GAMM|nr:deoxyribodipyrimidine photo-lyase [Ferrimonas marina]SHI18891.1 deoxyribodipyrimidine photo-lyase [Ferrimonas marina]